MEFLKALFEAGALTWEQFSEAVNAKGYKLADLSTGNYVSKAKFDDEVEKVQTRDTTISELNGQIKTRDTDIKNLQTQLNDGSKDNDTKIADLTQQLTALQGEYKTAKTNYDKRIASMNYEYAVKDYAATQKFSSNAAKRDFINEMISANLTMQDKAILGADDFANMYREKNSDAFVVETPTPEPTPEPKPAPTFVQPTPPTPPSPEADVFNFNFAGVR
jgi:chromosome segregation ATPase